jgi:hypothetical protein
LKNKKSVVPKGILAVDLSRMTVDILDKGDPIIITAIVQARNPNAKASPLTYNKVPKKVKTADPDAVYENDVIDLPDTVKKTIDETNPTTIPMALGVMTVKSLISRPYNVHNMQLTNREINGRNGMVFTSWFSLMILVVSVMKIGYTERRSGQEIEGNS